MLDSVLGTGCSKMKGISLFLSRQLQSIDLGVFIKSKPKSNHPVTFFVCAQYVIICANYKLYDIIQSPNVLKNRNNCTTQRKPLLI